MFEFARACNRAARPNFGERLVVILQVAVRSTDAHAIPNRHISDDFISIETVTGPRGPVSAARQIGQPSILRIAMSDQVGVNS